MSAKNPATREDIDDVLQVLDTMIARIDAPWSTTMQLGTLTFRPITSSDHVVAAPTRAIVTKLRLSKEILAAQIDPTLADTASFCAHYCIDLDISANCIIVEAKRADKVWYAACVVPATGAADINGAIRRHLGARKISFAPMDTALALTGMEYGGITPIGLPAGWPILIDASLMQHEWLIVGAGLRSAKLAVTPQALASLPGASVLPLIKLI